MTPLEAVEAAAGVLRNEDRADAAAEVHALRVVAAGGGTGLPRVLSGLVGGVDPQDGRLVDVAAIVTTSDDGGSSGELSRRYGVAPPGDARNCLVALTEGLNPLAAVFQHRFDGGGPLAGHTVGNVVLTALAQRLGDFGAAVRAAARMLAARGRVLPAAVAPAELVAILEDGRVVRGETAISACGGRIARLALAPSADAPPDAIAAVLDADVVVLGPGSLYSSVLASLLPRGLPEALRETAAVRVLAVNLYTQPGETGGYTAADHLEAIHRHIGDVVDVALVHRGPLPGAAKVPLAPGDRRRPEAGTGARPVVVDREALEAGGVVVVGADLASAADPARHDAAKLARALLGIARARGR